MNYRSKIISICLISMFIIAGTALAKEFDLEKKVKEFTVSSGSSLKVSNIAGDISAKAWDKNIIKVTYIIRAKASDLEEAREDAERLSVDTQKRGNKVMIKVEREKAGFLGFGKRSNRAYVDFMIMVPEDCNIELGSVSGDARAEGLNSSQSVGSVSGDAMITNSSGKLDISSVSGDIRIDKYKGSVKGSVVSGDARFDKLNGSIKIEGVSSDIRISNSKISRLIGETVSGDLKMKGEFTPDCEIDFESVSGDVELYGKGIKGLDYYMKSFSGSISLRLPSGEKMKSSKKLKGKSGSGGASAEIHTLSGDIVVSL